MELDPILTIFAPLLAASLVGAVVIHAFVKHYLWACIISAATVGVITYWRCRVIRGAPPWSILGANVVFAAAISAGVGIPFNRRRTGHGLGATSGGNRRSTGR